MFSQRFKSKYTIGAFLLLFACSPICLGESGEDGNKDNKVNILFSYGLGGPLKPNNEFFAGENIYCYVEADASLTKDAEFDLAVTSSVLRKSNENAGIDIFMEHQNTFRGFVFEKQSVFHVRSRTKQLPENLTSGNYVLLISVHDGLNDSVHQKQVPIIVKEKHEFGLRNILFLHGAQEIAQVPGSNVFRAGDAAIISCILGGMEENNTNIINTAEIKTEVSLLNSKNEIVCSYKSQSSPFIFNGLINENRILPLPQPGEFIVKLRVEDTISGKADTCELPLIVLPVPSPVSATK